MKYKNIPITFFTYLFLLLFIEIITTPYKTNTLIYTIIYLIGLIITIIVLSLINKIKIKKSTKKDIITITKIFIIYTTLIIFSTYIINKYIDIPINELNIEQNIKEYFILSILNISILTPIIEEITFRYSFNTIKNKYLYIIITTIIFSICHINNTNEILYLIPYSLMGIMFSYSYIKTNNILSSILCHIVYNIINLIILFI